MEATVSKEQVRDALRTVQEPELHRDLITLDFVRVENSHYCCLCGNNDMIYEAHAILRERGVGSARIFAEVYF